MKSKRLLILGFSLLIPFLTYSQKDSISKYPTAKNFMVEINFNPFGHDGVFSFENLQTKYWVNNKTALRLGLQLDNKNNSTTEDDYKSEESSKPTISEKSFLLGFKPGIEFRILPNSRISPYWGVEFSYINKSSSSKYIEYEKKYDSGFKDYVYNKIETNLDGAWRKIDLVELSYSDPYYGSTGYRMYQTTNYTSERAFSSYGLNLLLGTDVFVYKNLYMGFEIGIGYKMLKYKQIKLDINDPSETDPTVIKENKSTYPSSKTSDFSFYYNNSIRLGIYF